jgi:hypothetical protein
VRSDLRHAAVREDLASGHGGAVIRGEEERYSRDIVRVAYASERSLGDQASDHGVLVARFRQSVEQSGRCGSAGRKNVHADSGTLQIQRPTAGKIADRRLARAVDAESWSSHRARRRSVEDDGPSLPHQGKSLLHGEYRTFDIHAENQVEGRFRDLAQGFEYAEAGVGEQDIEASAAFTNRGKHSIEVGEIRDVTLNCENPVAYFAHRRVELLLATAADKDGRPLRHEAFRGRESDAAVTAGDQRFP